MGVYVHDNMWASRRITVLAGIVIFHILLIWGLANGLARRTMDLIAPPIETKVIEEKVEEDKPPPPPPPKTEIPPVQMPPPIVEINVPADAPPTTALSNVTDKPPPVAPPAAATVPGTRASLRGKNQPLSDDYYPPTSKRLEEQGNAVVEICVGENGKIAQEPVVKTSSNFPRLDEAAIKYAKALRVQPGTANGKPITDCFNLRVKFELKNN